MTRVRARVQGTVQGVGFRPYVFRLARELGIAGHVLNDAEGVVVEAEAAEQTLERFMARLRAEAPPLAVVERIVSESVRERGEQGFTIRESSAGGEPRAPVAADSATCEDCLRELAEPANRRHRYPFINCTNCGPRFTIVTGVPYDRPSTTMAGFAMCPACLAEYEDPADRRFHAQPNACPGCGPTARLLDAGGIPEPLDGAHDAVRATARALLGGAIVAVKGVGGYHLACRADDEAVVAELRHRKHREDRPFALMARDLDAARELVQLEPPEELLLTRPARPIVLARRRANARAAASVAPGVVELGLMLPYSPLHHLLAQDTGVPLVMTSGNLSDEPIAFGDDDALARLAGIADLFLTHNRPIRTRTDDSVVRVVAGRPLPIRRSRGYVPQSIPLEHPPGVQLLACGAELKNTFALCKDGHAWIGPHVGDLKNYETLCSFGSGIDHLRELFAVSPSVVAHDLHPDYLSSGYARGLEGVRLVGVQHHHAHLAACLAEHGEPGPAIGAIYDGTGYGEDGTVWGGELLLGGAAGFERVGMLYPVALPGGDAAVKQPWRMAGSWLLASGYERDIPPPALGGVVEPAEWTSVLAVAASSAFSPITTSMGRLFDAVGALCGFAARASYEGQAAVQLEAAIDPAERGTYELPVVRQGSGPWVLDARPCILELMADLEARVAPGAIAGRFHNALARATTEACIRLASEHGIDLVVLSGGVFQNRTLLERTGRRLRAAGLRVLRPELLPPNDGGIAYGQLAVAATTVTDEGSADGRP